MEGGEGGELQDGDGRVFQSSDMYVLHNDDNEIVILALARD